MPLIHTSKRTIFLHHLGLSNPVCNPIPLNPTLIRSRPPTRPGVFTFDPEVAACLASRAGFIAFFPSQTTSITAYVTVRISSNQVPSVRDSTQQSLCERVHLKANWPLRDRVCCLEAVLFLVPEFWPSSVVSGETSAWVANTLGNAEVDIFLRRVVNSSRILLSRTDQASWVNEQTATVRALTPRGVRLFALRRWLIVDGE